MTTVDCPWCQAPAEVTAVAVRCDACDVTVPLADAAPALDLAA